MASMMGMVGGEAVKGIGGLLQGAAGGGKMGGMLNKAAGGGGKWQDFATGNGEQILMPESDEDKFGKQAAADKSSEDMVKATQAAQQISQPGQGYTDMGGLLGLDQRQMGNAQQQAMALAGNSNAKMYQKMLLQQMMGGGR